MYYVRLGKCVPHPDILYIVRFEEGIMCVYLEGILLDDGLFCNVIVVHIR